MQAGDCCERAIYLLKTTVLRYHNMEMYWAYHINIDRSFSKWKMGGMVSEVRNKYFETSEMGAWRHTKMTRGYVLLIICLLSNTAMTHGSAVMVKCALYPYSYTSAYKLPAWKWFIQNCTGLDTVRLSDRVWFFINMTHMSLYNQLVWCEIWLLCD